MPYNFLKDVKSIRNSSLCVNDSLTGYTTNFNTNGDVDGWDIYNNIYLYGSWKGILFGSTKHGSCYIQRTDSIVPLEAESFYTAVLMMKVIPKDGDFRPSTAELRWTTINDSVWDVGKSQQFDLIDDGSWNLYTVNLGPNSRWQGLINNLRLYPIINGKNGDRFIIRYLRINSRATYKCANTQCSYYLNFEHNCPGAGSYSYVEAGQGKTHYTTIKGVNDELLVNIDGYGSELVSLGTNVNTTGDAIAKVIANSISRVDLGSYAYSTVEHTGTEKLRISSGAIGDGAGGTIETGVVIEGGSAAEELGFYSGTTNISLEQTGTNAANGFDYYSSKRLSYFEINSLIDSKQDEVAISYDPESFNVEIGRRDFENSSTSNALAGITTTTESTKNLLNINSTIVDYTHPASNSGRLKVIRVNGKTRKNDPAKVCLLRPYKDGTLKLIASYPIPDENTSYIYTTEHITYKIDCDIFISKGDLIGVYNLDLAAPFSQENNLPNASYWQFSGEPPGERFDPGSLHSYGIIGFNIYGRSTRRLSNLSLDIDIGKITNIDDLSMYGQGLYADFEYNIASCLDLSYQIDLHGEAHHHFVNNYYALPRIVTHTNITYGEECLKDMVTSSDNGRLGDGWGNGSDGVFTTGDHAYFYVNGDAEWLHNGANLYNQVTDLKYEFSWSDTGATIYGFEFDPISFMLIFPEEATAEIHKTKIYFKDKHNFKSLTLASYLGENREKGNGPRDFFQLVPYYNRINIDGTEYNYGNLSETFQSDFSHILFANPTPVVKPKYINGECVNRNDVASSFKLNWNIIEHEFNPIDCRGFMVHTGQHQSTKITEMEIYSRFYVGTSLSDKIFISYSRYGNDYTATGFVQDSIDDKLSTASISSAIRYIRLEVDSQSGLEVNEVTLSNSNDIKLNDCNPVILLSGAQRNSISDVYSVDIENVYDKTYDLTVSLPRDVVLDSGWLSWITLENAEEVALPRLGSGAIINKAADYPINCVHQQLANNCDTWVLNNIVDGKPIYLSVDGNDYIHLTDCMQNIPLSIFNTKAAKKTEIEIQKYNYTKFEDSSGQDHTVTPYYNLRHSDDHTVLGQTSAIEFHFKPSTGSTDQQYLEIDASSDFNMSTNPFTIEFFFRLSSDDVYWNSYSGRDANRQGPSLLSGSGSSSALTSWGFHVNYKDGRLWFMPFGTTQTDMVGPVIEGATWYHVAVVSTGTLISLYVNGSIYVSTPQTLPFGNSTEPIKFGKFNEWLYNGGDKLHGQATEIRVSKGVSRYTGSSFTVPTAPFTTDSYTKLLIHSDAQASEFNSNYWKIQSHDLDTFTVDFIRAYSEDVLVPIEKIFFSSPIGIYTQMDEYSYLDSGYNVGTELLPALITTSGTYNNTGTLAAQTAYFSGNQSSLIIPNHADFIFGADDFTVECWIYLPERPTNALASKRDSATYESFMFTFTGQYPSFYVTDTGTTWQIIWTSTIAVELNKWTHLAYTRKGTTWKIFVDGIQGVSGESSISIHDTGADFCIGCSNNQGSSTALKCYLAYFRVSDVARYTNTFVPPVNNSDLIVDSNTKLALTFSELTQGATPSGIIDSSPSVHTVNNINNIISGYTLNYPITWPHHGYTNVPYFNWITSGFNTSNSYLITSEHTLTVGSYGTADFSDSSDDFHGPTVTTLLDNVPNFIFRPLIYLEQPQTADYENAYTEFIFKDINDTVVFKLRIGYVHSNKIYVYIYKGSFFINKDYYTYSDDYEEIIIVRQGRTLDISGGDTLNYVNNDFFDAAPEIITSLEVRFTASTSIQSEVKHHIIYAKKLKISHLDTIGFSFEDNTVIDKLVLYGIDAISTDSFDIYRSQFNVDDYQLMLNTNFMSKNKQYPVNVAVDLGSKKHLDIVRSYGGNTNSLFMNKLTHVEYSAIESSNPNAIVWNNIKPTLLLQMEDGILVDKSDNEYDISQVGASALPVGDPSFTNLTLPSVYFNGTARCRIKYQADNVPDEPLMLHLNDFTITWWEHRTAPKSYVFGTGSWYIYIDSDYWESSLGSIRFHTGTTSYHLANYSLDEWAHYAITRRDNTLYMFKNGRLLYEYAFTEDINSSLDLTTQEYCYFGAANTSTTQFTGWINDFMVIAGTALWINDFEPPTNSYTFSETDYTNARWLKFNLTNGTDHQTVIDKLGIYPDIASTFQEGGGYNCDWTNFGDIITDYDLFTENLSLAVTTVTGSSYTSVSGLYSATTFWPENVVNGRTFPHNFDECWGWSVDDPLPTLTIHFDKVYTIDKIKMYHGPGQGTDYICEDYTISTLSDTFVSSQTDYSALFFHYDTIDLDALATLSGITVISGAPNDYTILYGHKADLVSLFCVPALSFSDSAADSLSSTGYMTGVRDLKAPLYTRIYNLIVLYSPGYYGSRTISWTDQVTYFAATQNDINHWSLGYGDARIYDDLADVRLIDGANDGTDMSDQNNIGTPVPSDWVQPVTYTGDSGSFTSHVGTGYSSMCYWASESDYAYSNGGNYYCGSAELEDEIAIASQELVSFLEDYIDANDLDPIKDYTSDGIYTTIVEVTGNTSDVTIDYFDPISVDSLKLEITSYTSAESNVTSNDAGVNLELTGGFLREFDVYKSATRQEINCDEYPVIATNLRDNFNITSIGSDNNQFLSDGDYEYTTDKWNTDYRYLYYADNILSDPHKVAFRPNINGKLTYYDSLGTGYSSLGYQGVPADPVLSNYLLDPSVYLDAGTYTVVWESYNNIRKNLISVDIEGVNEIFRLWGSIVAAVTTVQTNTFTLKETGHFKVSVNINDDEADTWGAQSIVISRTLENTRWLTIKNDFAENYAYNNVPSDRGVNYINNLLVFGDERYNPVEYSWWWTSYRSTLSNDGYLVKESKRSLQIDYPTSSGGDYVEYLEGDDFGIDEAWSELDKLCFWWYIDDVTKLDTTYGGFLFGSTNSSHKIGFYTWSLASLTLVNGWNYLELSFNEPSKVFPLSVASTMYRPLLTDLSRNISRSFSLLYRGKGAAFSMRLDSLKIIRNYFDTEVHNGHKGLCLVNDDSLHIPIAGLDVSKGAIEFWLRPYYDSYGYDIFNESFSKTFFTLVNNSNEMVSLGLRAGSWLEVGVGNAWDNYKAIYIEEVDNVIASHLLFGYMEPVHLAMSWSNNGSATDNGDTIRLYVNGELVISSSEQWDVTGSSTGAKLVLGGGNTTLAYDNDADGSGIFYNLKVYNYCKDDFDSNKETDDILSYNPADFVELSSDGVNFYNNQSTSLPIVFNNVPVDGVRTVYIRANKDENFVKSRRKAANLMIEWITTI